MLARWEQGLRNGALRYRERRKQGYRGSQKALYRYLARLWPVGAAPGRPPTGQADHALASPLERLSVGRSTWLFRRKAVDLNQEEQADLSHLRQASPEIEAAYQLVQTFLQMVRERTGPHVEVWLQTAETSHLPEFEAFAAGVRQDQAAIFAGLALPWSQGPTEGHMTRLKLSKRRMDGRAKFDVLRLRVLYRAPASQKDSTPRAARQGEQPAPATIPRTGAKGLNLEHTTPMISEVA